MHGMRGNVPPPRWSSAAPHGGDIAPPRAKAIARTLARGKAVEIYRPTGTSIDFMKYICRHSDVCLLDLYVENAFGLHRSLVITLLNNDFIRFQCNALLTFSPLTRSIVAIYDAARASLWTMI